MYIKIRGKLVNVNHIVWFEYKDGCLDIATVCHVNGDYWSITGDTAKELYHGLITKVVNAPTQQSVQADFVKEVKRSGRTKIR